MKRIALFLLTSLAILVVLSIVLSLLGVDSLLAENGVDLDLQTLLIFSVVIGMTSSLLPEQMAAFGINGGLGDGFKKLFMSHPPLVECIANGMRTIRPN